MNAPHGPHPARRSHRPSWPSALRRRLAIGWLAAAMPLSVPAGSLTVDGVVEAVRQTVVAPQVGGAVVKLLVQAGDRVAAGQALVQLDAREAEQAAAAGQAQWRQAQAQLELAELELRRQRSLAASQFISAAALDRFESQVRAARAQAESARALADAAATQRAHFVLRAPYAGVVSQVAVTLGDMAGPGRPLLTLHDPTRLRVAAAVPLAALGSPAAAGGRVEPAALRLEIPGLAGAARQPVPTQVQWLPTADPTTQTVTLRADLPAGLSGVAPGQFARVTLLQAADADATGTSTPASPWVPRAAIVRRAELTGVYVFDGQGRALLRQVRLGRRDGERVEVLAGLSAGERVVADAATHRPAAATAR
jgi:RND family efflux transporter MFP subunit